jgi:hypothetical protein
MTFMTRSESFKKLRLDKKKIDKLYREDIEDSEIVKENVYD